MARRKKHHKARKTSANNASSSHPRRHKHWMVMVIVGLAAGCAIFLWQRRPMLQATPGQSLPSLSEMFSMTAEQLEDIDIGLMNLRCAEGLRGSEGLDVATALKRLDQYATHVEHETTRHLYKFRRNPSEFQDSEAYFRMLVLATVLQEDFKIRYNPERIEPLDNLQPDERFCANSRDVFIHGLTG